MPPNPHAATVPTAYSAVVMPASRSAAAAASRAVRRPMGRGSVTAARAAVVAAVRPRADDVRARARGVERDTRTSGHRVPDGRPDTHHVGGREGRGGVPPARLWRHG